MSRVEISSMPWGTLLARSGQAQGGLSATIKNLDGSNATTWSAVTGGSSSTSSLTSDANGNLPGFIEGGQYTLDVTALGVSGRRVEAVSGSVESGTVSLTGAATAHDALYYDTTAGKVKAKRPAMFDVTEFGAIGDGSTDDTAAIQAAIDAAGTGAVLFPAPSVAYKITAALALGAENSGLTLKGIGWWDTCTIRQHTAGVPVITTDADNTHSVVIEDLHLDFAVQAVTGDTQAYGIMFTVPGTTLSGIYNWTIRRVLIEKAKIGIGAYMASGTLPVWGMTFDNIYIRKVATSLIDLSAFTSAGQPINKFRHIQSIANTVTPDGTAIVLRGEWTMDGLDIEDWTNRILFSGGGRACSLRGVHVERLAIVQSATRTFELQDAAYDISSVSIQVATASASNHSCFVGNANTSLRIHGIGVTWDPSGSVTYDVVSGGSTKSAWLNGLIKAGTNSSKIRAWTPTSLDGAMVEYEGTIPAVTALPTASATYRGRRLRIEGGVGVADATYLCRKKADDTYEWFAFA